jgi:hypothetical protein
MREGGDPVKAVMLDLRALSKKTGRRTGAPFAIGPDPAKDAAARRQLINTAGWLDARARLRCLVKGFGFPNSRCLSPVGNVAIIGAPLPQLTGLMPDPSSHLICAYSTHLSTRTRSDPMEDVHGGSATTDA